MKRIAKKIAAAVLSLTLVLAVSTSCFGAAWSSYFGKNEGWVEGAAGALTSANAVTGYVASISEVGWGGIWGGQVFLADNSKQVNIKKGQKYTLSFNIKSSNVLKYVYVKVVKDSKSEVLAYSYWIRVPAGNKGTNFSKTFTAKTDAKAIYFGIGGDAGDRTEEAEKGGDVTVRYNLFDSIFKVNHATELMKDAGGDFTAATKITVSNFSVLPTTTVKAVSKKAKTVKVTAKKASTGVMKSVAGYQFKVGKKTINSKKPSTTVKKLKSGKKVTVQVRTYSKDKKYGAWSKAVKVKVK